jgi:hypothetical protein
MLCLLVFLLERIERECLCPSRISHFLKTVVKTVVVEIASGTERQSSLLKTVVVELQITTFCAFHFSTVPFVHLAVRILLVQVRVLLSIFISERKLMLISHLLSFVRIFNFRYQSCRPNCDRPIAPPPPFRLSPAWNEGFARQVFDLLVRGAIKALLRRHSGAITALLRLS